MENLYEEFKSKLLIVNFFLFLFFSVTGCKSSIVKEQSLNRSEKKEYILKTILKTFYVGDQYTFCDTGLKEEGSCFLNYKGKRYLKKSIEFVDSAGEINKAAVYKPEGLLNYSKSDLLSDSMLLKINDWKIRGNEITVIEDTVFTPIKCKIDKYDKVQRKIYCFDNSRQNSNKELLVFEFW